MNFGESLKQLRTEKGFTQQQLAEQIFVDRSSIARWESGARLPDAIMISRLSKLLDADIAELLNSSDGGFEPPNIIILDDERIILKGEMTILEQAFSHATITGFTRPSEAIHYASVHRVDIAYLDIEIGNVSGFDVCSRLLEINPRTNIIFLTAYSSYSLDAWDTKACGFLLKPVSVQKIIASLDNLRFPLRGGSPMLTND